MSSAQRWPRSAPSAEGVSARGVLGFLDAVAQAGLELHSCMIVRHGAVIAEGWWRPYAAHLPHMLFSLSKSFASTAVGMAVHEGRLSVDDRVAHFFPEDCPDALPAHLAEMRVRHLLTMGTGHSQDTTGRIVRAPDANWVRAFLRLPVENPPGGPFVYNSGATYMLSAIVQKVTGRTLLEYLDPRLLQPLGIAGAAWETSPQGICMGGWGLSLATEDIARFGQLYLQKGVWQGRQVVPPEWVSQATSAQISNAGGDRADWAQGYGYQFWRCRHGAFRGDGAHGQYCIVMPEQDAVVAITGAVHDMQAVLDCVWDNVLPAMGGAVDRGADAALAERLTGLTLPPDYAGGAAAAGESAPRASEWANRSYRFVDHPAGLESLALEADADACRCVLTSKDMTVSADCGWGRWRTVLTASAPGQPGTPVAGRAVREPNGALRLDWRWVLTPFGGTLHIEPDGGALQVNYRSNLGEHTQGVQVRALPGPREAGA